MQVYNRIIITWFNDKLYYSQHKIKEKSIYYRVYCKEKFLGLGEIKGETLKPKCVF